MPIAFGKWTYDITVLRVVDYRTLDVLVDLGFSYCMHKTVVLANLICEESATAKATSYTYTMLGQSDCVRMSSLSTKNGRVLVKIYYTLGSCVIDLSEDLVTRGYAARLTSIIGG